MRVYRFEEGLVRVARTCSVCLLKTIGEIDGSDSTPNSDLLQKTANRLAAADSRGLQPVVIRTGFVKLRDLKPAAAPCYGIAHGEGAAGVAAGFRLVDRFFAARFLVARFLVDRFLAGFRLAFFAPFFFGDRFLAADFFAALRFFAMVYGSFPDSTQVIQVVFPLGAKVEGKTTSSR